jgi:hypothetical protein
MERMKSELEKNIWTTYEKSSLLISNFSVEPKSKDDAACRFSVNGLNIVCRKAKISPKKVGQFVTFWKRNAQGITEPLHDKNAFDFYVINVNSKERLGQFIIPKSVLIANGIVSTHKKEGKRGFRDYPSWDVATSKQAQKTQDWQLNYFVEFTNWRRLILVKDLFLK